MEILTLISALSYLQCDYFSRHFWWILWFKFEYL